MPLFAAPIPRDAIADPKSGWPSKPWVDWFSDLVRRLGATAGRVGTVTKTAQAAAIATTAIAVASLTAGLYRVTYTVRLTQAATTSSSVTVTIGWIDNGIACSLTGAALTTNTVASVQTGTALIRSDAVGPISYAVAYSSVGATPALFAIDVTVEALPA